jgi:hypothetical protein
MPFALISSSYVFLHRLLILLIFDSFYRKLSTLCQIRVGVATIGFSVSLFRFILLCPLCYFSFCSINICVISDPKVGFMSTRSLFGQVAIISVADEFRPIFVLPRRCQPHEWRSGRVRAESVIMTRNHQKNQAPDDRKSHKEASYRCKRLVSILVVGREPSNIVALAVDDSIMDRRLS